MRLVWDAWLEFTNYDSEFHIFNIFGVLEKLLVIG
jgi:hypothetical protein